MGRHRIEGGSELACVAIPVFRILLQTPVDHAGEPGWNMRRQPWRGVAQNRRREVRGTAGAKRTLSRRHLVEHDAERPDVRTRIGHPSKRLRRHVRQRAGDDPRRVEAGGGSSRLERLRLAGCETEVENLATAVCRHTNVRALEIAVHDAVPVCVRDGFGHLPAIPQDLIRWQSASANEVGERAAADELHRHIHDRIQLADVVNRANRGVVQRRRQLGFANQTRSGDPVVERFQRQHFQRDVTLELRIACPIHFPHSTGPNQAEDFVGADALPDVKAHPRLSWDEL